ncbi:MAG: hypothetical protein HN720_04195, partial [Nitrospinaceae bacterium]|nr:hypothetical protein [Nitrospinaceae bacterium]
MPGGGDGRFARGPPGPVSPTHSERDYRGASDGGALGGAHLVAGRELWAFLLSAPSLQILAPGPTRADHGTAVEGAARGDVAPPPFDGVPEHLGQEPEDTGGDQTLTWSEEQWAEGIHRATDSDGQLLRLSDVGLS